MSADSDLVTDTKLQVVLVDKDDNISDGGYNKKKDILKSFFDSVTWITS